MTRSVKKSLTKEQKTGFVLLLVFALLVIGLGILRLRNTIYGPYVVKYIGDLTGEDPFLKEQERLQSIDTDRDGLNDYEELQFYQTSPYLPDTDSDGVNDRDEVLKGDDPLCPIGTACDSPTDASAQMKKTPVENPLIDTDNGSVLDAFGDVSGEPTDAISDFEKLLSDPAQLRKLLISSGSMTEEELAKFDDETLLEMASKIMSEQSEQNAVQSNP